MQTLTDQAVKSARQTIAQKFSLQSDFEELGATALLYEKQLAIVEGQLNSAVQSKLDSLKRAVDLMDESSVKLSKLSSNIQRIDEKITLTNTNISKYKYLKRVHNAKENLNKVIEQVKFFSMVPERVSELLTQLHEIKQQAFVADTINIGQVANKFKEIYLESIKFESLTNALLKELKVTRHRRQSIVVPIEPSRITGIKAGFGEASKLQKHTDDWFSEENSLQVEEFVEKHIDIVKTLIEEVRIAIYDNIDKMFDLSEQERPEILVVSFEILEMQYEYNERRNARLRKLNGNQTNSPPSPAPNNSTLNSTTTTNTSPMIANPNKIVYYENIREIIQEKLKILFEGLIQREHEKIFIPHESNHVFFPLLKTNPLYNEEKIINYGNIILDLKDSDREYPQNIRLVGTQINIQMKSFQNYLLDCIPNEYQSMQLFVVMFQLYIIPRLRILISNYSNLTNMKVSDILDLISWFDYIFSSLEDYEYINDTHFIEDITSFKSDLLMEYKDKIKAQINSWFINIKTQELEITKNTNNRLVTSHPEDMFNILYAQLNVAKEKLPPEYVKEVMIACIQVLQDVQRQSYDSLINQYHSMEAEVLCSIINDNQRMEEKCKELSDDISRLIEDHEDREMLEAIANEVAMEYLLIANTGVRSLARCIIEEMEEPIFSKLFLPEWETGKGDHLISTLVVTLEDYFGDLAEWIEYYHYSKLVKEIFVLTIGHYVMSLRKRANGTFNFMNEIKASMCIQADIEILIEFFEKSQKLIVQGGWKSAFQANTNASASNKTANNGNNPTSLVLPTMAHLFNNSLISEEYQILTCFQKLVMCRNINNIEDEIIFLFIKYGMDGCKLVQTCFVCNPSLGKNEKQSILETIKKMFDTSNHKYGYHYLLEMDEEYKNFDNNNLSLQTNTKESNNKNKANNGNNGGGGFWGRRFISSNKD